MSGCGAIINKILVIHGNMAHRLLRIHSWLAFSLALCSSPLCAQTPTTPARSISLPPACQHPFRELHVYGGGQRIALKSGSGFCRVDVASSKAKQLGELGELDAITPAPKGFLVATVSGSHKLTVLDDEGQSKFDGDLASSGAPAIYWSSDESHVIVFSFPDESNEADTATVINIPKKTMRSISLNPAATVRFDAKTDTLNATQQLGKASKVTVYDLEGKVLHHEVVQKTHVEHIFSASRKYYYVPHHEVGEGDSLIHLSLTGHTVLRMPEGKKMDSRYGAIWDNPKWNPVGDDLVLLLYLSNDFGKGKHLTEFDVFSISKGKPIRVFTFGEKGTPAYGWSADGKQIVLCDVDCSFYSVP